jgi:hypothetical protein
MKRFRKQNLSDAPSGRQTMLPDMPEGAPKVSSDATSLRQHNREARSAYQASPETWEKINRRAGEIAMNKGKRAEETGERDIRRASRELLGLQTLMWRRWSDYLAHLPEA